MDAEGIRSALKDCWRAAERVYFKGRINSERTLQAVLHAELSKALPDLIVLCEPELKLESKSVFPDIVLIDDQTAQVAGVLELKFVPQYFPKYESDLRKLAELRRNRSAFPILLNPLTGKYSNTEFRMAPESAFAFGAIGRHNSGALTPEVLKNFARSCGLDAGFLTLACPVVGDGEH